MQKGRPYRLKGARGSWPLQKKDYQMFTIKPKMVSSSRQIVGGPVLALQKSWEFWDQEHNGKITIHISSI